MVVLVLFFLLLFLLSFIYSPISICLRGVILNVLFIWNTCIDKTFQVRNQNQLFRITLELSCIKHSVLFYRNLKLNTYIQVRSNSLMACMEVWSVSTVCLWCVSIAVHTMLKYSYWSGTYPSLCIYIQPRPVFMTRNI